MRIYISHKESYMVRHMVNVFYPNRRIVFTEEDPFIENFIEGAFCVTRIKGGVESRVKGEGRKNLKESLYKALVEKTGIEPVFGMLTGVRPSKICFLSSEEEADRILRENYVSKKKIELLMGINKVQEEVLKKVERDSVGVYIGIPFCPSRCNYCSFASYNYGEHKSMVSSYIRALKEEMKIIGKLGKISSVYVGGGTPTSLDIGEMEELFKGIEFSGVEYTFEAGRPDTITKEKLEFLKSIGVNRISINPQTLNNKTLKLIGRNHRVEDFFEKYELAKGYFDNINVDIIIGLLGEEIKEVENTFLQLGSIEPESLTVHTLSVKRGSDMHTDMGNIQLTKNVGGMMDVANRFVDRKGYRPYYLYRQKNMLGGFENIGYYKTEPSIYNVQTMSESHSIISFGAGGITKVVLGDRIERIATMKNPKDYVENIDKVVKKKDKLVEWGIMR